MRIGVSKTANGGLRIRLGEVEAELSMAEVKTLLVQILGQMAGTGGPGPEERFAGFVNKLAGANDVGIETLIRSAHDDDVLVLLKSAEGDDTLTGKLYRNMSERSRKMYQEDLGFRFADGIPDADLGRAASRLTEQARELESAGLLSYGG